MYQSIIVKKRIFVHESCTEKSAYIPQVFILGGIHTVFGCIKKYGTFMGDFADDADAMTEAYEEFRKLADKDELASVGIRPINVGKDYETVLNFTKTDGDTFGKKDLRELLIKNPVRGSLLVYTKKHSENHPANEHIFATGRIVADIYIASLVNMISFTEKALGLNYDDTVNRHIRKKDLYDQFFDTRLIHKDKRLLGLAKAVMTDTFIRNYIRAENAVYKTQ